MRSRLIVFTFAVLSLLVVESLVRLASGVIPEPSRWSLYETHVKSRQIAGLDEETDVVFLGSSITAAGIDPDLLGVVTGLEDFYNAAIPGATPLSQEAWLGRVVLPSTKPSLLVIGLLPFPVSGTGEQYAREIERAAIGERLSSYLGWSSLATSQGVFADWDLLNARDRLDTQGFFTEKGHFTGFYDRSSDNLEGVFGYDESGWLNDIQMAALDRMVESGRSKGSDIVVLLEPGRPDGIDKTVLETYNTRMHQWADAAGIEVWDAWRVPWEDHLFGDEVHFNREGTVVFTRYIGDLLKGWAAD